MHEWIFSYVKQFKGRMSLTVLFGFLGVFSGAMLLFMSGYLISKTALRPENIMMVYVPIVSVRAFSISQAVFPYIEKLTGHDVVLRILTKYRKRLYDSLEAGQQNYQTGDIFHILSEDIEALQDFFMKTLFPSIIGLVTYVIIVLVIGSFDLVFMIYFLALFGVLVFLLPYLSYVKMKQNLLREKKLRSGFYRNVTDALFGQMDWLISGRWPALAASFAASEEELQMTERERDRWGHIRMLVGRLVGGIAVVLMIKWTSNMTDAGMLTPTLIAAFVLMTFSIIDAMLPVSEAVEDIPIYEQTVERMQQIGGAGGGGDGAEVEDRVVEMPSIRPVIRFNNLHLQYEVDGPAALEAIDLEVQPGEKIALLGKSGAGKSSLFKLLTGLLAPTSGSVFLDDVPAHPGLLGKRIAVLNQKPHLFHTSIANNIRMGRADATDTDIVEVLVKVDLWKMVEQLPEGIHTSVEELGKRFSGGERQRIAFARILVQQTPIILLDEPTTGLDPVTERNVLQTFVRAASDRTLILITHHLIGAAWMDRIIFLENGSVKMTGSHEELVENNAYYRSLYEMDQLIP